MLYNKADEIEDYILKMLSEKQSGQIELKRTDLADEVSCAPSQISYVLSTRFTNARGFKVESRRGLGGYIRITILGDPETEKRMLYESFLNSVDEETTFNDVKLMLDVLLQKKVISVREAELVAQTAIGAYRLEESKMLKPEARSWLIRSIFTTLSKIT